MKYLYREPYEVEKQFYVFGVLANSGHVPVDPPKIEEPGCFWESTTEFSEPIDSQLIAKINDLSGVSFLSIST